MFTVLAHFPYVFLFQHGLFVFLPGLILASALVAVFWAWMLVACLRNGQLRKDEKVIWAVAIACTHLVGAVVYFFCVQNRMPHLPNRPMTMAEPMQMSQSSFGRTGEEPRPKE